MVQRPFVEARLHAARLDPLTWTVDADARGEHPDGSDGDAGTDTDSGTGDSMLAALRGVDTQLDLRVERLDLTTGFHMRQLVVSLALKEGNARIDPLRFDIAEGQMVSTLDLDASEQWAFGRLETQFDGIIFDRLVENFTPLENRLGSLSGVVNLDFTETPSENLRDDVMFPFIGSVRVGITARYGCRQGQRILPGPGPA